MSWPRNHSTTAGSPMRRGLADRRTWCDQERVG